MQLVLPVLHAHDYCLDNFITGENASLIEHVRQLLSAQNENQQGQGIIFVHGAMGTGKTHLLLACHQRAETSQKSCQYIDMQELRIMPSAIIQDVGLVDVLCIDNIDAVSNDHEWQVQIFDQINRFIENNGRCLMIAAKASVHACEFSLPDLASRLMWGTTFFLHELSEQDKVTALTQHFKERGIGVQKDAILFLMKRTQRDMHKLMHLVERLDRLSLQSQRKLTIPFIKQSLSL